MQMKFFKASKGIYPDESGPEMARLLQLMSTDNLNSPWPLATEIVCTAIVPDDIGFGKTNIYIRKKNIFCLLFFYE